MLNITAVIPVRYNDRLLPHKNILPFAGTNLLIHKIRQLKQVKQIDHIIVSSESDLILEMAQNEGVEILKRPEEFSSFDTDFGSFVNHVCNQIQAEHILWACVTSPLVQPDNYEFAITTYFEKLSNGYDSLITVQRLQRFLLDNNGPLNFRTRIDYKDVNELPDLFIFTNGIVIAPRMDMIKWRYNWGVMPFKLEIDKKTAIDICDAYDYEYAKLVYDNLNKL